jgi:ATP-dependent Clp protease ATP-binding subunit ClpX
MFKRRLLHCSFCGKNENEVAKLVAGPKVFICERCVAVAQRIMEEGGDGNDAASTRGSSARRHLCSRLIRLLRDGRARIKMRRQPYSPALN